MDAPEFRQLGHHIVDLLSEYFEHIEEKPVFPDVEEQLLTELFAEPLPQAPSPAEKVLAELEEKLLPYCTPVGHPGYMGLITPSPNPVGVMADFLRSALNQNIGAYTIGPGQSRWSAGRFAGSTILSATARKRTEILPAAA